MEGNENALMTCPERRRSRRSRESIMKPSACEALSCENGDEDTVSPGPSSSLETRGKVGRSSTRRRSSSQQICPICGITVRSGELEQHLKYEVQQLDQVVAKGRVARDAQASYSLQKRREQDREKRKACVSNKRRRTERDSDDSSSESDSDGAMCLDGNLSLLEVRANRQARERRKELLHNPAVKPETMLCPVCFSPLLGSEVERNRHVENCLSTYPVASTSGANSGAGDPVDVEGDGAGPYQQIPLENQDDGDEEESLEGVETYEWAGQTRIRPVSLVRGGYQGMGYHTVSTKPESNPDGDDDLDVDGDETEEFGPQQYSEEDVLARSSSRTSMDTGDVGYEDHVNDNLLIEGCLGNGTTADHGDETEPELEGSKSSARLVGLPSSGVQMVIESLKARVEELEAEVGEGGKNRVTCQICMGAYTRPLVSIQCWHVHCEECWLATLACKKLCPQCQMITAPSQLRRLYL
ncbi:E3 ubiquitin-protein ligase RNF220-like [Diadema setosum]|uniref:E3 ubiquitin-protein ligase RNF220-like n=1 Tax=Diadema setosum TaxID=31175 RepID=UPI003B3A8EBA